MNYLNRKLGLVENLFEICHSLGAIIDVNIACIEGIIPDEILRQALDLVQKRHPLLQVGIIESEEGFRFISEPNLKIPLHIIDKRQDNQWLDIVEEEVHKIFPNHSIPLCRVIFIRASASNKSEIIVTFHHAITDGISCVNFFHELLLYCQQISSGFPIPEVITMPTLPAIENLIDAKLWQTNHIDNNIEIEEAKNPKLIIEKEAPTSQRRTRLIPRLLSQDTTLILKKRCKQEGTTVHGALCAAMLLGVLHFTLADKPIDLSCGSSVNLRKYCAPEINNDYIGCFISEINTNHILDINRDFWNLARECKSKINDSIKSGIPFKNINSDRIRMINHELLVEISNHNMGRNKTIYVSNLGQLNLCEQYGITQIKELYFVTGQHVIGSCFWLGVVTFHEQLFCSFAHVVPLISAKTAEVIANSVIEIMQKACI
ncbi:hypothetical protein NIES4071_57350 [Calothrix sp. NIES-4071]|nr:hypothetical protein NIES4071_57350 [Calothrix sp. NIES-4071]BAZ60042.1 hypothetical protein NIES4105_57300 [Calothrix sp. NIES-4105]